MSQFEDVLRAIARCPKASARVASAMAEVRKRRFPGDELGAMRDSWYKACGQDGIRDPAKLAFVMRRLCIRPDEVFDVSNSPWRRFSSSSRIAVVIGDATQIQLGNSEVDVTKKLVGPADLLAFSEAMDHLRHDEGLRPRVIFSSQWRDGANGDWDGVVYIGSPIVNPPVDEVAKFILSPIVGDGPPPVRFRWNASVPGARGYLSFDRGFEYGREGLAFYDNNSKEPDAPILARIRRSVDAAGRFADCGLVLVDYRAKPIALALGHGGSGTMSAVFALRYVHDEVCNDPRINLLDTSEDVIMALVKAKRPEPSDKRTDWDFYRGEG